MEEAEHEYLTFTLDDERYALSVRSMREVLGSTRITKLPCSAPYLLGLINLRGSGVPVIDLRKRFGIGHEGAAGGSAIVVVEMRFGENLITAGLLADAVHEVISLDQSAIDEPPLMKAERKGAFFRGVAKSGDGFLIILDAEGLLDKGEMEALAETMRGNGGGS
jgi:purine-binding chemotaxis protein CheW